MINPTIVKGKKGQTIASIIRQRDEFIKSQKILMRDNRLSPKVIASKIKPSGLIPLISSIVYYHEYTDLLTKPDSSAKIKKSLKEEKVATWILYMSPSKLNSFGKNICGFASRGCIDGCLAESGRGGFGNIKASRISKTNFYFADRPRFLSNLYNNIASAMESNATLGKGDSKFKLTPDTKRSFRLNGTSDLPWHKAFEISFPDMPWFKCTESNPYGFMTTIPNAMFYDYTKDVKRANEWLENRNKGVAGNYYLTLSRSETNEDKCIEFIRKGGTSAIVFMLGRNDELPQTYKGIPVIDGDVTDVRYYDNQGVWVGLRWKVHNLEKSKDKNQFGFAVVKDNANPVDWYPEDSLPFDFAKEVS